MFVPSVTIREYQMVYTMAQTSAGCSYKALHDKAKQQINELLQFYAEYKIKSLFNGAFGHHLSLVSGGSDNVSECHVRNVILCLRAL